jgi:PAS domain S-box-containing protein
MLIPLSELVEIPKGEIILKEGEVNSKVYFLLRGEVSLYSGGQHILNLKRKGDIFGERSIIQEQPNASTIIAETPVQVFCIKSQDIGGVTNIETDEFHNILYRLFAIIMTDKLSLTTHKAKKYEITQNKLLKEITEHKQAEEKLRVSEECYRTLFERSSDAIFIVDIRTGKYINANQAAEQLTGLTLSEIKTKTTKDLTPEGAEQRLDILSTFETSKELGEVKYVRTDGKLRDTLLTVIQSSGEQIIGIAQDITDRKQAEEELKESEWNLKRAQRISKIGSWYYDMASDSLVLSNECFNIFGLKKDDYPDNLVPESVVLSVYADPEETEKIENSLIEKSDTYDYEYTTVPIDGKVKYVHSFCEVERDNNGNVKKIFGTDHDITERKQVEEALRGSEKSIKDCLII